ncbi:MAG TPA: hypothetical protein VE866_02865 [Candidatus Binatia bacterium]|nr:hypothetical protein [Candidatus Binatia bacterium]
MAKVVSGIEVAPLGAAPWDADFVAGAAGWGAAAAFRFSRKAAPRAASTARATILHRIIVQSSWVSIAALNHISGRGIPSSELPGDTEREAEKFRFSYEEVGGLKMMQMFYKS